MYGKSNRHDYALNTDYALHIIIIMQVDVPAARRILGILAARALMSRPKQVRNVALIGYSFQTPHSSGLWSEESGLTKRLVSILGHKTRGQTPCGQERPRASLDPAGWAAVLDRGPVISLRVDHTAGQLATSLQCENKAAIKPKENTAYLLNLVDPPSRHVARVGINGINPEVTAALRLVDGALVVVDCVAGILSETEAVLCQALSERVKPVLHVANVDACLVCFGWIVVRPR